MIKLAYLFIALILAFTLPMVHFANASYNVTNLNVTVNLNQNRSAQVTEIFTVLISNQSVKQYSTNRVAFNLTLSNWQSLIGPILVQHIINPNSSIYNFKFLPGPVTKQNGQDMAYIIMSYSENNVTSVNETAPRQFLYKFNPRVLNFEHGASGEVLSDNTSLTFVIPNGALITSVYPLPDLPLYSFTHNFKNVTQVTWLYGEPLSKFNFEFIVKQGIQTEVETFFDQIYKALGLFTYVILAIAIILFLSYVYLRAVK